MINALIQKFLTGSKPEDKNALDEFGEPKPQQNPPPQPPSPPPKAASFAEAVSSLSPDEIKELKKKYLG